MAPLFISGALRRNSLTEPRFVLTEPCFRRRSLGSSPRMPQARDRTVGGLSTPPDTQGQLSSWYAPGVADGLGDRLLMFDNTKAPSWELLRFRPEFAAARGFEHALRTRVAQLARFDHPSFPAVRGVEDLGSDGLALVSTYVAGKPLREFLERPRSATAAMRLIQQLAPAIAALQQQGPHLAHGVLTCDRIALTLDGRFVICEHVLGSAIQSLGLSAQRLWVELGVALWPIGEGVPRLDPKTDVMQIALVALSLMLGRRVDAVECPHQLEALLDYAAKTSSRGAPLVFPPLGRWLRRALHIGGQGFESAQEASDALAGWADGPHRNGAEFELSAAPSQESSALQRTRATEPLRHRFEFGQETPAAPRVTVPEAGSGPRRSTSSTTQSPQVISAPSAVSLHLFPAERDSSDEGPPQRDRQRTTTSPPAADREPARFFATPDRDDVRDARSEPVTVGWTVPHWVAAAACVLVVAETTLLGYVYLRPATSSKADTAILVESLLPGSKVLVDGQPAGVTPLRLKVGSPTISVRVLNPEAPPSVVVSQVPPSVEPPARPQTTADARSLNSSPAAASPPRSGSMKLSSSIELRVFEGEALLGSNRGGSIEVAAGRHELDLVNLELGYRSRRVVNIRAGRTLLLEVTPASGSVSVNASPWADVWIDGKAVGETPLAKLSVPLGEHEFVFRHPQLGEKRQSALVRADGITLVSAKLGP